MKRNSNFDARSVAGRTVLMPNTEVQQQFNGMITMNATGKILWDLLETEQTVETLAQALVDEFAGGVTIEVATADVQKFVDNLKSANAIIE